MTRIFHACDVHGNELVWKKIVRIGPYHKADIVLMCGDLTGKAIVPIVRRKESEWYCNPHGEDMIMHSEEELEKFKEVQRNKGLYVFETTPEELKQLQADPRAVSDLFTRLMKETIQRWLELVKESTPKNVRVVVNPGNDDIFEIDEIVKNDDRVIYPLDRVVSLDDTYEMISCAWVNPTPWKTPRECSEQDLRKKLEKEYERVGRPEHLVCNFHAPPFGTTIDLAPKLKPDKTVVTSAGAPVMEHVGSRAVREFIEEHQLLLGLHGHIHEACGSEYLKRTLCLNPGSEYQTGILRGFVIDLPRSPTEKTSYWRAEA